MEIIINTPMFRGNIVAVWFDGQTVWENTSGQRWETVRRSEEFADEESVRFIENRRGNPIPANEIPAQIMEVIRRAWQGEQERPAREAAATAAFREAEAARHRAAGDATMTIGGITRTMREWYGGVEIPTRPTDEEWDRMGEHGLDYSGMENGHFWVAPWD